MRRLKRPVDQVDGYAAIVEKHLDLVGELAGVVLGHDVALVAPCEKWIVWPPAPSGEPRENELAKAGIRVANYEEVDGGFVFRVGRGQD